MTDTDTTTLVLTVATLSAAWPVIVGALVALVAENPS